MVLLDAFRQAFNGFGDAKAFFPACGELSKDRVAIFKVCLQGLDSNAISAVA
jgi:hypothetical protein